MMRAASISTAGYAQVRELRLQATRLRREADELNAQADALEQGNSDRPLIGGMLLRDAAVDALRAFDAIGACSRGQHYLTLAKAIEQATGRKIRGRNASATLLANIDREPRIESAQPRSGRYRLAGEP